MASNITTRIVLRRINFVGSQAPSRGFSILSHTLNKASREPYSPSASSSEYLHVYRVPKQLDDFGAYERTSFLKKITNEEAQLSPPLLALHSRLGLSESFEISTLARCLICRQKENDIADNFGLSLFGKNVLMYYVSEYLITNYPRLPVSVLNAAIDAFIGKFALLDVARVWGIEEETKSELERYLADEPKEYSLGKLRYDSILEKPEDGVVRIASSGMDRASAFASTVRSVIAGVYAHDGADAAKKFIYNHILSRKVDVASMFEFHQPIRQLYRVLKKENMEPPISRLISETGRQSNSPVFIVGVFSGDNKLGEGQGGSILEAKTRAAVQSLKGYYLYRPIDPLVPSDEGFKGAFVDSGEPL